ncbi:MAG: ribonuclease Y [Deltaproteobacteria bacterium]|nr:ribonuclease Y [Deltaproteobacteria bacterium]
MWWAYPLVALAAAGLSWVVALALHRKQQAMQAGEKRVEAERLAEEARRAADEIRRKAELDAKEHELRVQAEFEQKTRITREELQRLEERLLKREDNTEKKNELLGQRENDLTRRDKETTRRDQLSAERLKDAEKVVAEQRKKLEQVAALTADEAKKQVIEKITDEARRSAAREVKRLEDEAKEESEKSARRIIGIAIQRYAGEHVAERAVTTVHLPNDEMKGRIIGREGRNIRAIEAATGTELVVDDTPETVVVSGFDPVRREIARLALERLIADGRIHPTRIEEVVAKAQEEVDKAIKDAGERAVLELGIGRIHPDLVRILGQLKYRYSYAQNVLQHSIEAGFIAGLMASELGLPVKPARRAGLLHDIGKAVSHEVEGSHAVVGAQMAKKCGEDPMIINAIGSHHEDEQPESVLAHLVAAADAVSGARPGARRETLERYVKRLEDLERICVSFPGVDKSYALQAGREVRVMVKADKIDDAESSLLATEIAKKIETSLTYPGQIKVTVIRETRAVQFAK